MVQAESEVYFRSTFFHKLITIYSFISVEEAIEIALEEFSGKVEEAEFDEDDGRYLYEIEIENGDKEAEFEIDAVTGEIIDMEIDD